MVAEKSIGGAKQLAAHAGGGGERAHQQKQRHHREIPISHRSHSCMADDLERRTGAGEIAEARHPDQTHRHANGHAQQHQHKQRDKADKRDRIRTHGEQSLIRSA
jgi:hypothetical protein